jgi:hypothetical protein
MFSHGFLKTAIALDMAKLKDMASRAGEVLKSKPVTRGAAAGAVGGAISGAANAPEGQGLSGAVKGALTGAAGGATVGYGMSRLGGSSASARPKVPNAAPAANRPPIEVQFKKISQYLPRR